MYKGIKHCRKYVVVVVVMELKIKSKLITNSDLSSYAHASCQLVKHIYRYILKVWNEFLQHPVKVKK